VAFEISKVFPPDRESAVVQLTVRHPGAVDIPAEVNRENGELRIAIFGRKDGVAWECPLDEWLEAVRRAVEVLGAE
jgi:hypothetical protein